MANYKQYTDLDVWLKSRELTKMVYIATKNFPKEELYGLVSQIRRSAISIPSNIAEGCGRQYPKESIHFFHISRGSLYELETQLYLSHDLDFITENCLNDFLIKIEDCKKLLNGFIRYYQDLINMEKVKTNN